MAPFLYILIGLVIGAGIVLISLYERLPGLMINENLSKYGFEKTEEELIAAVTAKGWKMPGTHDLQQIMKNNGYEVLQAKVFEICNPAYANQILKQDDERFVTSLMPCRVAIYTRSNGKTYISRMNAALIAKPMMGVVPKVMKKAGDDVEVILKGLIFKM